MAELPPGRTDCTPNHCSYGHGHACDVVTAFPEQFPEAGGWRYAWRDRRDTT